MPQDVRWTSLDLPEFGLPSVEPQIPEEEYDARIAAARAAMKRAHLDVLVVYGDREHFANLAWLTGYDPRFEESLAVLTRDDGQLTLFVGNEGVGYAGLSPVEMNVELFQTFSLLSQPRDKVVPLRKLLRKAGVKRTARVGVVGWKYFERGEVRNPKIASELPAFLMSEIIAAAPVWTHANATSLFMHPTDGLRAVNSVHQLAQMEFGATLASQMVRDAIFNLRVGMTEQEAVRAMKYCGVPLSCHLMLTAGERARVGLASPSLRKLQLGDPITMAVGLWGGLTARAGFLARDEKDLSPNIRDWLDKLVKPYFRAAAAWYETIGIGVTGGEIYKTVHSIIGDPFFGVTLNPGHLIHLDEWVSSPVTKNSKQKFASGMAVQCDIIPATGTAYFTTNIEDGIALADEKLRAEFSQKYPEAWGRIEARRKFMREQVGIQLKPEVLPFSNLCAYLPPFFLSPRCALQLRG
jgi:hypothetical protein